ncbi:hypothetical protein [uncultured phage MedDCM-OCT-S11-C349]|nr:hypothetical protein [uncultured phage MedDCM-OCT-S11-C349]
MAVSGSNVTLGTAPTLDALTSGTALGYTPGAYTITTAGDAFSYSEAIQKETTSQQFSQQQSPLE